MVAYDSFVDSSNLTLGKGIKIVDPVDVEKFLYPIWDGNAIVATLTVAKADEDTYTGKYSTAYAEQLNAIVGLTTKSSPLSVVVKDEEIYGVIGNKWFDLNGTPGSCSIEEDYILEESSVINARETINYQVLPQPRIPTTFYLPFVITSAYIQPPNMAYCYSFAMGNILYNMGYRDITPSKLQEYVQAEGATEYQVVGFLSANGFTCQYSESGYLPFYESASMIYNNGSYIYADVTNMTSGKAHAYVIAGYSDDGYSQLYLAWNPSEEHTSMVNADSRLFITDSSRTYYWDNGFICNIRKVY